MSFVNSVITTKDFSNAQGKWTKRTKRPTEINKGQKLWQQTKKTFYNSIITITVIIIP